MARRTPSSRRSPEQWRELVERQRRSGLSIAAFSRQEGLVYQTFVRWCRKPLAPESSVHAGSSASPRSASATLSTMPSLLPEFVEIGVTEPAAREIETWLVELELGDGMTLRVRRPSAPSG